MRVLVVTAPATAGAGLAVGRAGDGRFEVAGHALSPGDLERLVGIGSADVVVAAVNPDDERAAGALLALAAEGTAPPLVAGVGRQGRPPARGGPQAGGGGPPPPPRSAAGPCPPRAAPPARP